MQRPIMQIGSIGQTALSGFRAGAVRLANSAHNIANLATEGAERLRTEQSSDPSGGVRTVTVRDGEGIDLAEEAIEQIRGRTQAEASAYTLAIDREMHESLLDIMA